MICVLNDSRKQTSHHGKEARETQPQACGFPALPFHQNPPGITAIGQHFRKSRNVRDSAYLLCMAGLPVSTAHLPSDVLRSPHHQAICLSPSYLERNSGPHLYRKCFSSSAIPPCPLESCLKGFVSQGKFAGPHLKRHLLSQGMERPNAQGTSWWDFHHPSP